MTADLTLDKPLTIEPRRAGMSGADYKNFVCSA